MIRTILVLLLLVLVVNPSVAQYGPDGQVLPGDSYHICFATSFQTRLTTDTSNPPVFPLFGGIEAGSWITTRAAFQGGFVPDWNGLDVIYRAVLSDSTADAIDHTNIQGRVYNTAGELLALNAYDFFDGQIFVPIGYDEFGNPIPKDNDDCWSGNDIGGTYNTVACGNWDLTGTSSTFAASAASTSWLIGPSLQCVTNTARLIAMSPPIQAPGPGDLNCDGEINLLDVDPFILAVSSGKYDPKADMNFDGVVNLLDIDGFIAVLGGG